jgi:ABC-type bacteriocin/lantibiotic exporter with double-glycine peptidase domain
MTSVPQLLTDALQEILSVQRITTFLQKDDVEYLDKAESISSPADDEEPLIVVGDIAWSKPQERTDMPDSNPFVLRDLDLAFPRAKMAIIAGKFGSGKSLLLIAMLGEVALLKGRIAYAVSSVADPWETETAYDWSHSTQGLAYVPQVRPQVRHEPPAEQKIPWLQSLSIRYGCMVPSPLTIGTISSLGSP